jgi:hypothetical protein
VSGIMQNMVSNTNDRYILNIYVNILHIHGYVIKLGEKKLFELKSNQNPIYVMEKREISE